RPGRWVSRGLRHNQDCRWGVECAERLYIHVITMDVGDQHEIRIAETRKSFGAAIGVDINGLSVPLKNERTMKNGLDGQVALVGCDLIRCGALSEERKACKTEYENS